MVTLWRFFICSFEGQDVCGLQFSGQVVHGSGICKLILPRRNSLSLCVDDDVHNSSFSTAMMLSTTTVILVIWLWLISVQLAQAEVRGQDRNKFCIERLINHKLREHGLRGTWLQFIKMGKTVEKVVVW